jgi:CBS domain-containing protein
MLVSQILKSKGDIVFTIAPDESVQAAAALLLSRGVGAVIVLGAGDEVVGILSERDIVRVIAEDGAACLSRPVSSCMTRDVVFAEPGEAVDILMTRMTDRRFRHLPVCKEKALVGIVSIGDLVKAKIAEAEAETQGLKAYIAQG